MPDAAEYRLNAQVCADIAAAAPLALDRQIWLRMRRAWLELADKEEARERSVAAAA